MVGNHDYKLQLLNALPETIFVGEKEAILTRDKLEQILEPFRNSLAAKEYIILVRFLAKGLATGRRELGWKTAIPADLVTVPREEARFTPHSFKDLKQLRHIEKVLANSLTLVDPLVKTIIH